MKIMRSPDLFTRRGKQRMDQIVEQLIVSAPLDRPSQSVLMDGRWVQQGVVSQKTMEIKVNTLLSEIELQREVGYDADVKGIASIFEPTVRTYRFVLSGLLAVSRTFDFKPRENDFYTYSLTPLGPMRVSVCGLFSFRLPRRFTFRAPRPVRILYLDSDLQILCADEGNVWSKPEVFLKPKEFNEQMELRVRKGITGRTTLKELSQGLAAFLKDPVNQRSPFRFRDRATSFLREASEDAQELVERTPLGASSAKKGAAKGKTGATGKTSEVPSGGGFIGEVNYFAKDDGKVAWATDDDMLEMFQDESGFVVGDMLSGKLKRKARQRPKRQQTPPDP